MIAVHEQFERPAGYAALGDAPTMGGACMTTTQPTFEGFLTWLEDSRGRGQVHFDEKAQCWQVLGHPETSAILSDPAVFSSNLTRCSPSRTISSCFSAATSSR
jgi:hypothetical protein